jgi:hypothetical protein
MKLPMSASSKKHQITPCLGFLAALFGQICVLSTLGNLSLDQKDVFFLAIVIITKVLSALIHLKEESIFHVM